MVCNPRVSPRCPRIGRPRPSSDARNRQGVHFGEEVVLDIALTNREEPPEVVVERVFHALNQHTGDAPRPDDLTLVVVRI